MADPVSVASGIITLVTTGLATASVLLRTVREIKEAPRIIREIRDEIGVLITVLESLKTAVDNRKSDFSILVSPLTRCRNACQEFNATVLSNFLPTSGKKKPIQDWVKLKYLGSDIHSFKDAIGGYKSTIQISLGAVNLLSISKDALDEFKQLIADTTYDLQSRLKSVDDRLEQLATRSSQYSATSKAQVMQEEKVSLEKCLQICNSASAHAQHIKSGLSSTASLTGPFANWLLAAIHLEDCKPGLEERIRNVGHQGGVPSDDDATVKFSKEMQEERECLKNSVAICNEASEETERSRTNVYEDVSIDDDGFQTIVSTVGQLIYAKNVKAGARSIQALGQMSDTSYQQVASRNRLVEEDQTSPASTQQFQVRYGVGRQLPE